MQGPDETQPPRPTNLWDLMNPVNPVYPQQFQFPSTNNNDIVPQSSASPHRVVLKLPPMPPTLRRSTRNGGASDQNQSPHSGSEYKESEGDLDPDDSRLEVDLPEEEEKPKPVFAISSRGRKIQKKSYHESASEDDPMAGVVDDDGSDPIDALNGNGVEERVDGEVDAEGEDDEETHGRYSLRRRKPPPTARLGGFIVSDDEGGAAVGRYETRSRSRKPVASTSSNRPNTRGAGSASGSRARPPARLTRTRSGKRIRRAGGVNADDEDDGYVDVASDHSHSGVDSLDEAPHTTPEPSPLPDVEPPDADGEHESEKEVEGKGYALRQRQRINYAIPPPLEEVGPPPANPNGNGKGRNGGGGGGRRNGFGGRGGGRSKGPGWSASGAELSRWMGMGGDDSDSDYATRTPRKPFGGIAGVGGIGGGALAGGAGASGGGLFPSDLAAAAGTPSNFGKVGDAALADADPLGVNPNVTFDEVGGLDDHINALKEMTVLPLLYPEVFQRFNVTPPRGVLFHGPPGTGKTLLARALAASCRSNGKGISFFMRKGADCLSKWVGEAERQLRLLFEEARNSQPSIIFFDEIDGLAPVRSSKQDQIHASIVSTLLALMDGMDNRGQVVVIGATNRPDAIDPALRRPGRFDREFYFPLPSLEAREKILGIMTRKWEHWDGERGVENVKGLAKLTKGYGGADLRALCTEAALNAVQRRYPQIYKSSDRLLLKPETINVELRDFMISVKKTVPASARSVSSAASPLPTQLVPLLEDALENVKKAIERVIPVSKNRTALEEAEWEDEGGDGALEREIMLQSMESLRVYRPRIVVHGPQSMGQAYIAAAALHHLEGYHVQSLDLGNLMSDSARTVDAAIVQLFVEAKRHHPSVIYIPSLSGWCAAVPEASRSTVRSMLDSLAPTDPVLLLAVVDGPFSSLPRDVRTWFGVTRENRVELTRPTSVQREAFFEGLLKDIRRPPNQFPDGIKRKKRVLEILPIAPPIQPRQPTQAELALQEENDQRVIALLKYRLGPILNELKRKFKRFTKRAREEYDFDQPMFVNGHQPQTVETVTTTTEVVTEDGVTQVINQQTQEVVQEQQVNGDVVQPAMLQAELQLFDMDLERMNVDLYKGKYLTPRDFLDDIGKIVHNAHVRADEDQDRLFKAQAMYTATEVSMHEFDPQLRLECERMAVRERKRREEDRQARKEHRAQDNGGQNAHPAPPRRSGRNTGQQPELGITDVSVLERKLKRQRSNEAAPDSHGSGEEAEAGPRLPKRSRTILSDDEGGDDELDIVGPTSSQPRQPSGVRFELDGQPMPPLSSFINGNLAPSSPRTPVSPSHRTGFTTPPSPHPHHHHHPNGFDPSLLNPTPSILPNGRHSPSPEGISTPVASTSHQTLASIQEESEVPPIPQEPVPVPVSNDAGMNDRASSPFAMEIDRPPSPLPDFVLDEDLVSSLRTDLNERTSSLTVEHLEQLRATCLGTVWRHRTEWDRNELVRDLKEVVAEFVDQVTEDNMDSGASP
ncbi:hypothetical protein JAAARDRAFT_39748 [Jaapia argillacea MUCL 33604]|uniref:AAA+ ATPase domain-containing protein n=1 Tax=Jaapia argillacea MUCL 33604 TaxID=933084 RepID=A0A067PRS2_9AGAM|nr:hypothetical protein JAAARDRAFT_39748 [Jaapia argillacea MUCL 33604]